MTYGRIRIQYFLFFCHAAFYSNSHSNSEVLRRPSPSSGRERGSEGGRDAGESERGRAGEREAGWERERAREGGREREREEGERGGREGRREREGGRPGGALDSMSMPCQQLGVDLINFFKGWGRSHGFRRLG